MKRGCGLPPMGLPFSAIQRTICLLFLGPLANGGRPVDPSGSTKVVRNGAFPSPNVQFADAGLAVEYVRKVTEEGEGATVVDLVRRGRCDLVINTPQGLGARTDGYEIRRAAIARGIPCLTTLSGGAAAARAIGAAARGQAEVLSLQELHRATEAV